jgi:hypothetical protein
MQEGSYIVQFHGPKPLDYINYACTGNCSFGDLCRTAHERGSVTMMLNEWASWLDDGMQEVFTLTSGLPCGELVVSVR